MLAPIGCVDTIGATVFKNVLSGEIAVVISWPGISDIVVIGLVIALCSGDTPAVDR